MSEQYSIPSSWIKIKLGDVINYGETEKVGPGEILGNDWVLELEDIEKGTSKILQRITLAQRNSISTKTRFQKGDVLYGKLRPYLNKVIVADQDGYCTTEIIPLKPNIGVHGRYLFYWLKSSIFTNYTSSVSHGLNMPRLGTEAGKNAPFILAPLNEQKRIANKLDALLRRVDACRARLDRVPEILKRFRQAVLADATSGRLTEGWRIENDIPFKWERVKLSDVATSRLGKMLDAAKNQGILRPYLRNVNVRWFDFDLRDIQRLRITDEEAKNLSIRYGDLLVCEGGEPGRCAIWTGEDNIYVYQKALHRVRVGEKLTSEWISYCIKAASDSGLLEDYFTGTTIKHFTGLALNRFEFYLPSLKEQKEITNRIKKLFTLADRLESRYQSAKDLVDSLTPTLLAKAFRGELVPQDSNDESAYTLLENIKAERAKLAEQPKPDLKITKPRKMMMTESDLKDIIRNLPKQSFSFDELRKELPGDYEQIKDLLFKILSEPNALIRQTFDPIIGSIRFVRRSI